MFRSLFQVGDRGQPISQAVRELWGSNSSLTSDPTASPASSAGVASASSVPAPASKAANGGGLDLFSDRNGTFSG